MRKNKTENVPSVTLCDDGNRHIVTLTRKFQQFIKGKPNFAEAEALIVHIYGESNRPLVKEWYDYMERLGWCDKKGHTCRNWLYWYYTWDVNRDRMTAIRAVPKKKSGKGGSNGGGKFFKMATNYAPMSKEEKESIISRLEF